MGESVRPGRSFLLHCDHSPSVVNIGRQTDRLNAYALARRGRNNYAIPRRSSRSWFRPEALPGRGRRRHTHLGGRQRSPDVGKPSRTEVPETEPNSYVPRPGRTKPTSIAPKAVKIASNPPTSITQAGGLEAD